MEDINPRLAELEFYVLCPNGKRIRAEKMCEEFIKNPDVGYAYRSFENRLIVVVEAVYPEQKIYNGTLSVMIDYIPEKLYWRQAFYLSTGSNSGIPATWLPFSGIIIQAETMRTRYEFNESIAGTSWFSKSEFSSGLDYATRKYKLPLPKLTEQEQELLQYIQYIYGRLFLPEGNFLEGYRKNRFDRWGAPSYILASHALGGYYFQDVPGSQYHAGDILFEDYTYEDEYKEVIKKLNKNSPLQRCFLSMQKNYPPTNILTINQYIDKHQAIPIMNAFRDIDVFPPGLSFIQVPFEFAGYSIPITQYYFMLIEVVYYYWLLYKLNKLSAEQIRTLFSNPVSLLKKYITKERRKSNIFPNESQYRFKIKKNILPNNHLPFYGGTRKRKQRNKKTRKNH